MIERQVIDEVLARTDIQTLIGSYVSLRRSGSGFVGLCPFHSERSPSFTVFPADGSFYCFGCGVGGNAITFLRKMENLDFADAVAQLAKRAGITLRMTERPGEVQYDKKRYYEMNRTAARFFHSALYADTPAAKEALAYFTEKRRLSGATIKHFGLGYAPDDFSFVNHMKKEGYTEAELITGFLCRKSERGFLYPVFRNRVMFPIIDVSENIIAFGGRVMDNSQPKYQNSSDTPVFKKSRNLFALNFAHKACAERMILCEGYMDVIALHAAGFPFAVATLGTAITPEQARMMARYTKRVIISYDSDEAGQKAADKALKLLEEVGLPITVLKLNGAKDPDEYIKNFGADAFRRTLDQSRSKFDFYFENIMQRHDISQPQQKIEALHELCGMIARVSSSVEREIYMQEAAKRLEVDVRSISSEVAQRQKKLRNDAKQKQSESAHRALSGYGDTVNPDFARAPRAARAEEAVLGLLQLYPAFRKKITSEMPVLTEDDFVTSLGKKAFCYIKQAEVHGGFSLDMLDEAFTADEVGRLTRMRVNRMQLTDNSDAVLAECIEALKAAAASEKDKENGQSLAGLDDFLKKKRGSQTE